MPVTSAHTPPRVTERPPESRFCDLVLNGGVASGVVYPWALVELARHYRFRNIGGNSVGAMAAAIAAAAEYGRSHGVADAFEPLRRLPLELAKEPRPGVTKMLSLFQPTPGLRRLFLLLLAWVSSGDGGRPGPFAELVRGYRLLPMSVGLAVLGGTAVGAHAALDATAQGLLPIGTLVLLVALALLALAGVAMGTLLWLGLQLTQDLRKLANHGYGLCSGRSEVPGEDALIEWLHKAVQLSAGRTSHDPPLTFADLWATPRFGQAGPAPLPGGLQPHDTGIDLQMFSSNVTLGRPVRLPLSDANTRLFYDPDEWESLFPDYLLEALYSASTKYAPATGSDPDPQNLPPDLPDHDRQLELMGRVRELPSGGMPIVIAARMSLSFPLLFRCVPVWAIDYEAKKTEKKNERVLRRCLLSDGGLCSNFPVHLFDAAHPRWPTFALLLDSRLKAYNKQNVWLPLAEAQGRADNWLRSVPGAEDNGEQPGPGKGLLGLVLGLVLTMKDWNDRVTGRLPHVRNRMVRLALESEEGQLHIAMPPDRILGMAHKYSAEAARKLEAYLPNDSDGQPSAAWRQHAYVRAMIELRALHGHLRNYSRAVRSAGDTLPLRDLLREATTCRLLLVGDGELPPPGSGAELTAEEASRLECAIDAVEELERELCQCATALERYQPRLEPGLRLRPPV